ncbi:formylglycine-generating enzyme family protein [bacterium]|nr:formylglycine-generating enzyme family protein [bacterium]
MAVLLLTILLMTSAGVAFSQTAPPAGVPEGMKEYIEKIPESKLQFKMMPIPGGQFLMGSPESEEGRSDDEGPQTEVKVSPFWMGAHEITWQEFDFYAFSTDKKFAKAAKEAGKTLERTELDLKADAVARPTPPYVDMTFGYGHDGYPAICMTQRAAAGYCQWLAAKTGKKFRLPTEAEWEWACRAGTTGPRFFEDDAIGENAWYFENSDEKPQPVGKKKPNPWGLYDMLGNVSEWCADKYVANYFTRLAESKKLENPLMLTDETPWHSARGGSWQDDPEFIRSAARRGADADWSIQDPQEPKSIWWHTDAHFVGFRVVREYEPGKE